ncbi:MAG: tyrosine-type recombinase/integrase [Planctomycetota bacterium]
MTLLRLADGRHVARFTDPITRKKHQRSLDKLGLTNTYARRKWAIDKSKSLLALQAQISSTGALHVLVPIDDARTTYLETFGNTNTVGGKRAGLEGLVEHLAAEGAHHVQDITGPTLTAWGDHVRRPQNPHRKLTRNQHLSAASAWMRWCRRRGWLPRVTDDMIKDNLQRQRVPRGRPEVLQPAQIRKLLQSCLAHDDAEPLKIAPFVLFVLLSGCRYAEAEGLVWEEVDLDEQLVRLGASRTKTEHSRDISLAESPTAVELLSALRLRGMRGRVWPHIQRHLAERSRRRLMPAYDAPRWTWHMLRRTCGSLLVCGGVCGAATAFLAAKRLGHTVAVSESHYLGTLLGLPKDATSIEQAGGFEAEARAIVKSVSGVQAIAAAQ